MVASLELLDPTSPKVLLPDLSTMWALYIVSSHLT